MNVGFLGWNFVTLNTGLEKLRSKNNSYHSLLFWYFVPADLFKS